MWFQSERTLYLQNTAKEREAHLLKYEESFFLHEAVVGFYSSVTPKNKDGFLKCEFFSFLLEIWWNFSDVDWAI